MANISTAGGTITFFGKSPDDLVELILHHFIDDQSAYYSTTLLVPIGEPKETEDFTLITHTYKQLEKVTNNDIDYIGSNENFQYKITYEFNGSGLWSFNSNIEWFFPTIMNTNDQLAEKPFAALFNYYDIESGYDFAIKAETYVQWVPEDKKAYHTNISNVEYSYNKEGLIAVGAYNKDSIIDTEDIKQNPSIIYDQLDKGHFISKHQKEFEDMLENDDLPYLVGDDMEYIIYELEYYLNDFIECKKFDE